MRGVFASFCILLLSTSLSACSSTDEEYWERGGFTDPGVSQEWMDEGFSPSNAMEWKKAAFSPEEAKTWYEHTFTVEDAKRWMKNKGFGKSSGEAAARWRDAGFTPEEAHPYISKGLRIEDAVNDRQEKVAARGRDEEWKSCGFSSEEKAKWRKEKFDFWSACSWRKEGFSLGEAAQWHLQGFKSKEATDWRRAGFSPSSASPWKTFGFPPLIAHSWKIHGIPPRLAVSLSSVGISPSSARRVVSSSRRSCGGRVPSDSFPFGMSPYSLEGHCYIMEASTVFQLFGRSRGLMTVGYGGNELFYADTTPQILDSSSFPAIVKVVGVYKYETAMGSINIVPKVKRVISLK